MPDMDLIGRLYFSFAAIETEYYLGTCCEIWLNRADFEALGEPTGATTLFGHPVRASIGVSRGLVRVFDRSRMQYLQPKPEVGLENGDRR